MHEPKILFLIQHPDLPSSRVRVLDLVPTLREQRLDITVETYPSGLRNKIHCFRKLRNWDAVVLQKKLSSPIESLFLRLCSRRLLYDFDDAVYRHHETAGKRNHFSRALKFKTIARLAHQIIAGNETLAQAVRPYNRHVSIIPSAVPIAGIPQHDYSSTAQSCVIGWVGGAINLSQLQLLQPVLANLHQRHDLEFRVLCSESIDMHPVPTTFIPWDLATQAKEIAQFDIGVMPLPEGEHANGKCGFKALQYMAAAVPPVVSDTPVNRQIIAHEREGFVANNWQAFEQYLETLITQPALRRQLGHAARKKVETSYSLPVVGQKLADILLHPPEEK